MKLVIPGVRRWSLALPLIGSLIAGCGSDSGAMKKEAGADPDGSPAKTERARKAADFEKTLKTKTKRD